MFKKMKIDEKGWGRGSKCQGMEVKYNVQGSHNSLQKEQLYDLEKCTQLYYMGKHSLKIYTHTEEHILQF